MPSLVGGILLCRTHARSLSRVMFTRGWRESFGGPNIVLCSPVFNASPEMNRSSSAAASVRSRSVRPVGTHIATSTSGGHRFRGDGSSHPQRNGGPRHPNSKKADIFLRWPPSLQGSRSRKGSQREITALLSSSPPQHRINPSTHIVRRTGAAR